MANKKSKSNEQTPLYPVDLGLFGRKFTAAARLGYAEFQAKHRPRIEEGLARFGTHLRVTRLGGDLEVEDFFARTGTR